MKKAYSAIANLCLFLIIYFTVGINFETIDDITTSQLFYVGGFSVFSLQWISYISNLFNHIFVSINGYGLLLVLLVYISSYKLTEIIIEKETTKSYLFTKIGLLFIVDFWVLYQLQFTVVASFCLTVGTILINNFITNKTGKLNLIVGICLFFCGISLRKNAIIFAMPLILLIVLFNTEKKEMLKKSILFVFISAILFLNWPINFLSYSPEYKEYYYYNNSRSLIFDKISERTDEMIAESPEFKMLSTHIIGDTDYFTTEKMNEIYAENNEDINKCKLFFSNFIVFFPYNLMQSFTLLLFLLLLISQYKNKKDIYKSITVIMIIVGYIIIYSILNRYLTRIMFASTIPLIIYLLLENKEINFKKFAILLIIPMIVNGIEFKKIHVKQEFNRTEYYDLIEYINSSPANVYYQTLRSTLYTEKIMPALDHKLAQLPDNTFVLSWNVNHPLFLKQLEQNDIENPLLDLLEKDNYYLITANHDMESNIILDYLKDTYNISANIETKKLSKHYKILQIVRE